MKQLNRTYKPKRCKVGGEQFVPIKPFQPTCFEHAGEWMRLQQSKKIRKKNKELKRELMTLSDHKKELQVLINKFVRARDSGKLCISCDRPLRSPKGKGGFVDAGHFWSVGGNPSVRFDLDNIWGQCIHCNRDLHGNLLEYRPRLIERIGQKRFDELEARRHTLLKISIPEIKELITEYKSKIKELK